MKIRLWNTHVSAIVAVCTIAAVAASGLAAPQGDHGRDKGDQKDRHAQDKGDHKDRHAQDQSQNKHGNHSDKGKSPKNHGKHDNGRGHAAHVRGRGNGNAALGYLPTAAQIRERHRLELLRHRHHHVVYVTSHGNDDWKQIAAIAGLVAVIGLIEHDNTLVFVGAAGALYSLDRYNHDRHSHNRADRLRAVYFSKPYFYRNGHRYHRMLVTSHRKRYYRFVRG